MTDILTLGNSGNATMRLGDYRIRPGEQVTISDKDALEVAELLKRAGVALRFISDAPADYSGLWYDLRSE